MQHSTTIHLSIVIDGSLVAQPYTHKSSNEQFWMEGGMDKVVNEPNLLQIYL